MTSQKLIWPQEYERYQSLFPTDSYDGATGRPSSGAPRLGAANKLDWIIAEP